MQSAPSDPLACGATEQTSEYAIALVHYLVKEVEWIRMLASRLCGQDREPKRLEKDLESIRELSDSVAQWMRSFLDEARRAQAGAAELTEVGSLVDQAIRQVRRRGDEPSIRVRIDEGLRRLGVPSDLLVAVVAVLENSIESSRDGSEIELRVQPDGSSLAIAIEDSGAGMDAAVLSFCRAPGFTTRLASGGQGFGLFSACSILARNRGDLVLDSRPGSGTRVLLRIPVRRGASAASIAPRASGPGPRRRPRGSRC